MLKSYNILITETKNKITFIHEFYSAFFTSHVCNESTKGYDPLAKYNFLILQISSDALAH